MKTSVVSQNILKQTPIKLGFLLIAFSALALMFIYCLELSIDNLETIDNRINRLILFLTSNDESFWYPSVISIIALLICSTFLVGLSDKEKSSYLINYV